MTYPSVPPRPNQLTVDASNTINDDLEMWIPMTDQNILGQGAVDITANNRNATVLDSSLDQQGSFIDTDRGACYYCSTGNDSDGGLVTGDLGITLTTGVTFSCWYKFNNDNANYESIFASKDATGGLANKNYHAYKDSLSNRITVWKQTGSKNQDSVTSGSNATTVSTWHMITLRLDSSNIEGFVDGVSFGTRSDPSIAQLDQAGDYIQLGRNGGAGISGENVIDGYLQNFRLWSRPLSNQEIADLYSDPWLGSNYTTSSGGGGGGTTSYFKPIRWNKSEDGLNIRRL